METLHFALSLNYFQYRKIKHFSQLILTVVQNQV